MIKLIKGDCLVEMQNIPDKSIDCIICDLPYQTTACKWDVLIPFEPLWAQYKRIIKDNGAIVLFGSQPFTSALVMSNPKWFKQELIWDKIMPVGHLIAKRRIMSVHENILLFYSKQPTFNRQFSERDIKDQRKNIIENYNKRDNKNKTDFIANSPNQKLSIGYDNSKINPKSIISITKRMPHKDRFHPTQKPVSLLEYLIKTYTNEGDTVLDNTMGSGSTGVAAKQLNRSFIGIEMDDKYFEIAKRRIADAKPDLKLEL